MKLRVLLIATIVVVISAFIRHSWNRPLASHTAESSGARPYSPQPVGLTRADGTFRGETFTGEIAPAASSAAPTDAELVETATLCPNVPALPQIDDLKVSSCAGGRLSLLLESEPIDPGWAYVVARQIRERIDANDQGRQFDRVEIVCRRTACGLLLILPAAERGEFVPRELTRVMIEAIADETGFASTEVLHTHGNDGLPVTLGLIEHAQDREDFWLPPPEAKRIEALPGVAGYEIPAERSLPLRDYPTAPEMLTAEALDPSWAPAMESRILGVLASIGLPLRQVHLVCRKTRCGLVLDFPEGTARPDVLRASDTLTRRIMSELSLNFCPSNINPYPPAGHFAALYFEASLGLGCSRDL